MIPSRLTIRARITGGSLLIAILISVAAGILIFSQVQRIVSDGQTVVLQNVEGPYLAALAIFEDIDPPGPGQLVAVVDPRGVTYVDTLPDALSARLDELVERRPSTAVATVPGGSYLVRVTVVATSSGAWHVVSAVDNREQASVLNQVAGLLIASIAGINLAFGAASWLIGSAALSPVSRLRGSAARLVTSRSDELLPVGPAEDEITQLARTLNELIAQLRASADRERQIVSDASHELRTPLAILTTQLELAQKKGLSSQQLRSDITAAQHTLERLTSLATSLLELSRLDSGVGAGTSTVRDIGAALADCADRGRQHVGARDIRIEYTADAGDHADLVLSVTPADFGRACDNLVNNSLSAMEQSGVITLSLTASSDGAHVRVADDAGGMDEEFVPHAFDRFSRADQARTGGGAGLGLPIVQGIVTAAGGTATLENRVGEGLTVELFFPVREAT
jgi:two-component system, OmpR family, sensor kinase